MPSPGSASDWPPGFIRYQASVHQEEYIGRSGDGMESDLRFPLRRRCCRPGVNQCNQIPRGARAKTKPWALTSELVEAVEDRRVARRDMRSDNPSTKERWVEAKRRAAEVERRVYQKQFRDFVSDTLNKHQSPGRVHKTLKMWGGGCLRRPTSSW